MKWIKYAIIVIVILLIESTLSRFYELKSHTPDLLLLFVLYFSLKEGQVRGTMMGFAIGLLQDSILVTGLTGLSSLHMSISAFLAGYFHQRRRARKFPGMMVPISICVVVSQIIITSIYTAGTTEGLLASLVQIGLPSIFYTLLVAFFISIFIHIEIETE